jgi:FixJ family two-component response regulator
MTAENSGKKEGHHDPFAKGHSPAPNHVYLIEDHGDLRIGLIKMLEKSDFMVHPFSNPIDFLNSKIDASPAVLITDMRMPKMNGIELQATLLELGKTMPTIFISGESTVAQSVTAMKQGAFEFLTKPFTQKSLLAAVRRGIEIDIEARKSRDLARHREGLLATLSARELEVFWLLSKGLNNNEIVRILGISLPTTKQYKSQVLRKLGVSAISELIKISRKVPAPTEDKMENDSEPALNANKALNS